MSSLAVTASAPRAFRLRRGWTVAQITLIQVVALVPALLAALVERGAALLAMLALVLALSLGWELLFAVSRGRDLSLHGVTTAMIVAVMVPIAVPLWQVGFAVSFGAVLGELIFGGRGFGFLSAATAALAFLVFSFPGVALADDELWVALAALPAAGLLLFTGLISWRVIVSAGFGFVVVSILLAGAPPWGAIAPGLAFGLVFLVCDPLGAATTNPGRFLYGALVGGLTALFDASGGAAVEPSALVFATLLGSVFAPLLDHLVVLAGARRMRRRHD